MRIVLVTTKAAEYIVKGIVSKLKECRDVSENVKLDVVTIEEVPVAALSTTDEIAKYLASKYRDYLRGSDLIIIPGLVRGNTEVIEQKLGIKAFKGTKYAGDIPVLINYVTKGGELSKEIPADELISNFINSSFRDRIQQEIGGSRVLFEIRDVKFTKAPPPINLFYEVIVSRFNTTELKDCLTDITHRLGRSDYQGIILGLDFGNYDADLLKRAIKIIREVDDKLLIGIDVPLSVLRDNRDIISNVEILMNIDPLRNFDVIEELKSELNDKVLVIISDPIEGLKKIINELNRAGIRKLVIDAVLKPPLLGLVNSILNYRMIVSTFNFPLMMGLSNVYELMDVDTHGAIATLMAIGFELGISNVLITEESYKARGAIKEAHIAREMLYRAHVKKSPPINVGRDLLIIKDKKPNYLIPPNISNEVKVVNVGEYIPPIIDRNYFLRIYVDHRRKLIVVDVHKRSNNKVMIRFTGSNALSLGRFIIRSVKLSKEHVIYLGYELSKAEIALRLGKNYTQDEPLFSFNYSD